MSSISQTTHLKKVCVTKRGNKYYYPSTIPRERESMTVAYVFCLVGIVSVHYYLSALKDSFVCFYFFSIFIYAICNFIFRGILLFHELKHMHSRYGDSYLKIIEAAFSFKLWGRLLFGSSILYIVHYLSVYGLPSLQDKYWYFTLCFLFLIHKMLDMDSNPINDSLWIAKGNGLDYGSGMAYSFFYGYLNYILPKTGDPGKNLEEMMRDYESINNVKFEVYKIFILIPKSLTCHVEICDVSKLMEMRSSLPEKKITVAGVRDRVYKNSVYTIKPVKPDTKLIYVCTEYATPLKTFKEVFKNTTPHTEYYNRHKNDILLQFYLTLKQILEYKHMDKMCELIYYEDMDLDNKYHDVGRILLNRIKEIENHK